MSNRQILTDLKIKKLAAPEKGQLEIWDAKIPGFGIRISPKGAKSFVLMYRIGGRARRFTLGRYPSLSLSDAREAAHKALSDVSSGKDPGVEKRKIKLSSQPDHFDSIARIFIEDYAKRHNRSWKESERILQREFVPRWKQRPISAITRQDVNLVLDMIVRRGAPVQAVRALAAVRKLFNWSLERGYVEASPCLGITAPAKVKSRERVLSDDELVKILHASNIQDYPFGYITKLLIFTGQRLSEVASMCWEDIDLEKAIWSIPAEKNKSARGHDIPLTKSALEIIQAVPRLHDSLVFPARRHGVNKPVSGFSKAKKRLDELSGVTDWRQHDLRRTVATGMARSKVEPFIVEKVLNHSSGTFGGVAGVYNRFGYVPEMREALIVWENHVMGLVKLT